MSDLQLREQTLKQQIDQLQQTPLPVAEYFAKLTAAGDRRSARRDYFLFALGVLVSTVLTILLHLLGLA